MSAKLLNNSLATDVDIEAEFRRLKDWWNRETAVLSDLGLAWKHPAYRAIIALGPSVVPVLLRELRDDPDWWFGALEELTGANPLTAQDGGKLRQMSAKWLQWGREQGYDI